MKTQARRDRIRAADWRDPRSCGFGCWSGWRTPRTRGSQLLIPPEACGSWRGGREDSSGAGTVSQAPSTHEPLISSETAPAVPAEVQLTRLVGGVSGEGVKRCVVTIDGMSAGVEPRRVAENLRKALAEKLGVEYQGVTAKFRSLEDTAEGLAMGGKSVSGATFAIQAEFRMGEEVVVETGRRKR